MRLAAKTTHRSSTWLSASALQRVSWSGISRARSLITYVSGTTKGFGPVNSAKSVTRGFGISENRVQRPIAFRFERLERNRHVEQRRQPGARVHRPRILPVQVRDADTQLAIGQRDDV